MTVAVVDDVPARLERPQTRAAARWVEWLMVGGLTPLVFALSWVLRRAIGLDDAELAVGMAMFYAAHLLNDPHFAVTYALFYRDWRARAFGDAFPRAQRVRYWLAGVVVPVTLLGWGIGALAARSSQAIGWMAQLMLLLVGWHYAKQAFGVLTVLSARREITFAVHERRAILAHCYAAWAYAWANPARAAVELEEKGVVYWAPARLAWVEWVTGAALVGSTLWLLVVLGARWRRRETMAVGPLSAFVITIWLWTIYTALDPLVRYVIPALHALQYLYFVWLVGRNEARALEGPPSFGPPPATRLTMLALSALALGWLLFRGGPQALDAFVTPQLLGADGDDRMGETPFFAVLFVAVNVHHYFMDHVIWRRENPQTRYLRDVEAVQAG